MLQKTREKRVTWLPLQCIGISICVYFFSFIIDVEAPVFPSSDLNAVTTMPVLPGETHVYLDYSWEPITVSITFHFECHFKLIIPYSTYTKSISIFDYVLVNGILFNFKYSVNIYVVLISFLRYI